MQENNDIFEKIPDLWDRLEAKFKESSTLSLLLFPLDILSLFRPLLIVCVWLPALLGSLSSGYIDAVIGEGAGDTEPTGLTSLFWAMTFLGASVFIINQIFDREADKDGGKHLPIAEGLISVPTAWAVYVAVSVLALLLAFMQGITLGVLVLFGIGLGVLYSLPRFSFKDKPWGGLILNGIGHGYLIYVIGFLWSGQFSWEVLIQAIPYMLAYGGVYLYTTIPDIEQDRAHGKKTLAVVIGKSKTAGLGIGMILIAAGISVFVKQQALFLTGLFSAPFYIYALIKEKGYVRANMAAIILLTIFTSFFYFWLFPLVVIIAATIWFHNRMRFGVSYP